MTKKYAVSVIILNYNAEKFLRETLKSVQMQKKITVETIVVDNNSTDGSKSMVKKEFKDVRWVQRDTSLGFSAGNNAGLPFVHSDVVLFLNPDASFTKPTDLKMCLEKLESDDKIGALTARVNLVLTGGIDETCHRGFPTPWASFTHFSGLSKLFPNVPFFNQYTKRYLGYTTQHEIEAVGGMFMLMRKEVGEQVGWWDENYPLYGEDIDFCYRIHQAGYHNLYWPKVTVLHYKGVTTGMSKQSAIVSTAKKDTIRRVKGWSIQAMEIFYRKHYVKKYPFFINWLVFLGIRLMKFRRVTLA
ncbi:glycosyl transferase family 2 [Candidatus Collierbacteria bacterium CG10_big_fil_rev_8_21_14_0_10_44_9]|uniref:Glycosyl transferase family 2 n=1 Tax=Candidatus Collierbacteria bacterium CG10_big_fil_rev_8_21_14_0_10_44_9 TaxID=1974535 RepID=A0A2H0VJ57_9BACT|nr:MAG: glycosyl transferase family 2 [Candidatus Collierbacteria bacterium CG10_big_fil_rev_8_21_14_0_10_44_9]